MGLDHSAAYESYWNTNVDGPIYIFIQSAMTLIRFEQIKRFFKASDPYEPENIGSGQDFWKKVEPVVESFRFGARQYYIPGSNVSIDEFLIKFGGRSRHTMQISAKAGGKGFKLYGISNGDYLIDFLFTLKVSVFLVNICSTLVNQIFQKNYLPLKFGGLLFIIQLLLI